MTPEEIVAELTAANNELLNAREDYTSFTKDQVLALMEKAAMQGFKLGSNLALSMVKGALLVQMTRSLSASKDTA